MVITIIVLLILVGVTIATITGEDGILKKATEAKEATEKADADEQVKFAVLSSYNSNGEIDIDELNDNLRKIPKLTYNGKEIGETENRIETLPEIVNVNGYDISIDKLAIAEGGGTEGGETAENTCLARDVLKVDEKNKTSPYVIYPARNGKKVLCQVLYGADSEYGIQLITVDAEENVSLGYNDETVSEADFPDIVSEYIDTNCKKAIASYNKAVQTLNNKAEEYINPEYTDVGKARMIGSNPNFSKKNNVEDFDTKFVTEFEKKVHDQLFNLQGKIKGVPSEISKQDVEQLKNINFLNGQTVNLVSQYVSEVYNGERKANYVYLGLLKYANGEIMPVDSKDYIVSFSEHDNVSAGYHTIKGSGYNVTCGFSPVIQLKPGTVLHKENGDGQTPETAYEIEATEKKLATEVLKIDANGNSPYVNYPKKDGGNLLCQVLYEAESGYGLQIMRSEELDEITLGYGEENAEDFKYDGTATVDDNFKQAAISYNKAIKKLNDKAEEYINPKYTEEKNARSIGTLPTFSQKNSESGMCNEFQDTNYLSTYKLSGLLKDEDSNYTKDFEQINKIKNGKLSKEYWWPSRQITKTDSMNSIYFRIRTNNNTSTISNQYLIRLDYSNGTTSSMQKKLGIRPVFGIKEGLYIKSGLGTKSCPYNFE